MENRPDQTSPHSRPAKTPRRGSRGLYLKSRSEISYTVFGFRLKRAKIPASYPASWLHLKANLVLLFMSF